MLKQKVMSGCKIALVSCDIVEFSLVVVFRIFFERMRQYKTR